jgi:tRNA dimethylallyltransferase
LKWVLARTGEIWSKLDQRAAAFGSAYNIFRGYRQTAEGFAPKTPTPGGLRNRGWRVTVYCSPASRRHHHPLLARHPLEPALTVDSANPEPLLVALLGPTGSGKTALSLELAERFVGEIVNCDSVAMYREFDIGTAKPTPSERTRVPHHLFDCIEPNGFITAGEYARQARQILDDIRLRGHLPIVAGGTGLYLRALLEGLFPGPQRSEELRERLRESAKARGSDYLHRVLRRLDSAAAEKTHANDLPKIVRAIEVCLASRQKMTELWQRQGRDPLRGFRTLRLGLDPDRQALYERINNRAREMFDSGLPEETERLMNKYGDAATSLSSLGYKQAVQCIRGEMTREQALQAAQQAHRNYAKRQMTWFRREPDVRWMRGFGDDPQIQNEAFVICAAEIASNFAG